MRELRNAAQEIQISSFKQIEDIFEASLDNEVRKNQGAVYTPDYIIDFILELTISKDNIPTYENPVLDPACGSGGFLVRSAHLLSVFTGKDFTTCTEYLCGIDVNPKAISNARLLLDLACINTDKKLSKVRFLVCDSLIEDIDFQFSKLNIFGGVTALVTNPPYVKLQNLEKSYSKQLINLYGDIATGSFTLASIFLYKAPKYLTPKGSAGFITLNNVFTSLSAKNLRLNWTQNKNICKIIDFRHFLIFDASAYTCLVFMNRKINDHIDYNAVREMPNIERLRRLVPSKIHYDNLNKDKWRLGSETALNLVSAMENQGEPLKSIADIRVGFATLNDKIFVGKYIDGLANFLGGDNQVRIVEEESIINFFKVSEINQDSDFSNRKRPLIYPYDQTKDSRPLIDLKTFSQRFPIAFDHLKSWESTLRSKNSLDADQWHKWGRRQSLVADGPKLLTKTFDVKPTFRIDLSDFLFCNGYSVKPKDILNSFDIKTLKKFLESRFVYAYSLVTSFEISGGYQCYQKNFIENIHLPPLNILQKNIKDELEYETNISTFYNIKLEDLDSIINHYSN